MQLTYREPQVEDGLRMHQMVLQSAALDVNSAYLYALLATHYADTVVVADAPDGRLVGFVSAYRLPQSTDTLFIWQIAVDPAWRGQGVALDLLRTLTQRPAWTTIRAVHCTITADNIPSQRLFTRWAAELGGQLTRQPGFSSDALGDGHAPEDLFLIHWPETGRHHEET